MNAAANPRGIKPHQFFLNCGELMFHNHEKLGTAPKTRWQVTFHYDNGFAAFDGKQWFYYLMEYKDVEYTQEVESLFAAQGADRSADRGLARGASKIAAEGSNHAVLREGSFVPAADEQLEAATAANPAGSSEGSVPTNLV